MILQELIFALNRFWAAQKCAIVPPCDVELGAGAMHPLTFFRVLSADPWRAAYVQPTRRPADGRCAQSPNRTQRAYQYQVILKPSPPDAQELYLRSLCDLGVNLQEHDVRFVDDDWEAPTLGAVGVGWEVWLNGMEITRFTYLQQMGGLPLRPVSAAITYAPERLALFLQNAENLWDLQWVPGVCYGEIALHSENSWRRYHFERADAGQLFAWFASYEAEGLAAVKEGLAFPAYDYALKCSHTLALLDSRGALSAADRAALIERVRNLARECAEAYLEEREA